MTGKIKKKGAHSQVAAVYGSPITYTGPGDVVSGSIAWYSGARAYSATYASGGNPMLDLVDQAGANPITINSLSSGYIDITSINNWVTANSVTTIRVTKMYDQSGSSNHVFNSSLPQMPELTLSALNGLPGVTAASSRADRLLSSAITQAQPVSFSVVAKRSSGTGASGWIGSNTNPAGLYPGNGSAIWSVSAGTVLPSTNTVTESTFHAAQAVINGSSSVLSIDGATVTGNAGTTGYSTAQISVFRANGGTPVGTIMEAGLWPTAFSSAQYASINSNQHGSNGYNF